MTGPVVSGVVIAVLIVGVAVIIGMLVRRRRRVKKKLEFERNLQRYILRDLFTLPINSISFFQNNERK